MSVLTRIEEISEKFIEGIFKGKNATIQPVEIAKKLAKEMELRQTVSVSKVYVPNTYKVILNPDDKLKLASFEHSLFEELNNYLQEKARERGFYFSGKVTIDLVENKALKPGQITTESLFSEELPEAFPVIESTQVFKGVFNIPPTIKQRVELIVIRGEDEGMTFRLSNLPVSIGRKKSNDVCIDDPNVSRKHALVESFKENFYLVDLESLNGTFLNGEEITRQKLEDKDIIKIGTTLLRFRTVTE